MKTKIYILGLVTLLWSCGTSTTRENKRHKDLLWSRQNFVAECTGADNVYDSINNIADSHPVDFKYLDNLIIVSAYFMTDACGKYEPNIRINKDTVVLLFRLVSDRACSTAAYYKVDYVINNPQRKKYKIIVKYK
jgi:hypothetical protein